MIAFEKHVCFGQLYIEKARSLSQGSSLANTGHGRCSGFDLRAGVKGQSPLEGP